MAFRFEEQSPGKCNDFDECEKARPVRCWCRGLKKTTPVSAIPIIGVLRKQASFGTSKERDYKPAQNSVPVTQMPSGASVDNGQEDGRRSSTNFLRNFWTKLTNSPGQEPPPHVAEKHPNEAAPQGVVGTDIEDGCARRTRKFSRDEGGESFKEPEDRKCETKTTVTFHASTENGARYYNRMDTCSSPVPDGPRRTFQGSRQQKSQGLDNKPPRMRNRKQMQARPSLKKKSSFPSFTTRTTDYSIEPWKESFKSSDSDSDECADQENGSSKTASVYTTPCDSSVSDGDSSDNDPKKEEPQYLKFTLNIPQGTTEKGLLSFLDGFGKVLEVKIDEADGRPVAFVKAQNDFNRVNCQELMDSHSN